MPSMVSAQGREEQEREVAGEGGEEDGAKQRTPINGLRPFSRLSRGGKRTCLADSSSFPLLKKTRYVPDLTICHACGLRVASNNNSSRDRLRVLRSQWRIALLCNACLSSVMAAELCSYCFSSFPNPNDVAAASDSVNCLACTRRIHLGCALREQRCVVPLQIDPSAFTCIDCCAIPTFLRGNPNFSSRASLDEVVRDARTDAEKKAEVAAKAREHALEKAAAAKHAAERARNALGAVLDAGKETNRQSVDTVARDEELALRLHLEMNGSRRISRNTCSLSSGSDAKKGHRNGGGSGRSGAGLGSCGTFVKVEFCTEDMSFFDMLDRTGLHQSFPVELVSNGKDHNKVIDENGKDVPLDLPLKEEQGSCSDKVVNSHGDDCSIDSMLVYIKGRKDLMV